MGMNLWVCSGFNRACRWEVSRDLGSPIAIALFHFHSQWFDPAGSNRPGRRGYLQGGQVYVPSGINTNDVNPRPLSAFKPVN